jgi:hypothetical protein
MRSEATGPHTSEETPMNLRKAALLVTLGLASVATPLAFAADGDGMQSFRREVQTMATKDGMVTKKEFMAMMEKKFDAMDKAGKGMLSVADIMRIFSDAKGQ